MAMNYGNIQLFRESRITANPTENGEVIHYYAGTNQDTIEEEKIFITEKEQCGWLLDIENCSYAGNLHQLEDILWQWWHDE